jgi:transcriptional regulator with XRE-family HTH domain
MGLRAIFLREVDRFLKRTGQTRAQLSKAAGLDREFLSDFANGRRGVQLRSLEAIEARMHAELAKISPQTPRRRSR